MYANVFNRTVLAVALAALLPAAMLSSPVYAQDNQAQYQRDDENSTASKKPKTKEQLEQMPEHHHRH